MEWLWKIEWWSNEVGARAVAQAVVLSFFFLVGCLIRWWTQRKYRDRVGIRICWTTKSKKTGQMHLKDSRIISGNVVEVLGTKALAKRLIAAVKNTQDGHMLKAGSWDLHSANLVLTELGNRVEEKNSDGTFARALKDTDVVESEWYIGVFKRGSNEVSVIVVTEDDAHAVAQPMSGEEPLGDVEEMMEIGQLFAHLQVSKEFMTVVELAR